MSEQLNTETDESSQIPMHRRPTESVALCRRVESRRATHSKVDLYPTNEFVASE